VSVGGSSGIPTESLTFNYGKITTTYTKQARKGGAGAGETYAGWDLEKNKNL
jgi:type VI protein secretion system component Hcp